MTTTETIAGPGEYTLAAESWDQYIAKPGKADQVTRHRRGDVVKLDAADAERLWAAGALVRVGQALPVREPAPTPAEVQLADFLARQAAARVVIDEQDHAAAHRRREHAAIAVQETQR